MSHRRLAAVLKGLPSEHDLDLPPALDLPTCTYLWKLVSPEILQANLSIAYGDYLKALVCVDYFAQILAGEVKILENLRYIQTEIAKKTAKPMMTLDLVLVEIGLRARELAPDHFRRPDVRRRWEARDVVAKDAGVEPYYLAIASLVAAQVGAGGAATLGLIRSRQEIKAILFADAASRGAVSTDLLSASVHAVEALRDASTPRRLAEELKSVLERK